MHNIIIIIILQLYVRHSVLSKVTLFKFEHVVIVMGSKRCYNNLFSSNIIAGIIVIIVVAL